MKDPVLVSSTDGIGTKLLVAEQLQKYDTVGVDLVAMCVNDVIVTGAEPLFFLDYIACGKLEHAKLLSLMKGIVRGCQEAGCALLGGETAELPGMYPSGKMDVAGFCVGIIDREKIIDGSRCCPGDKLIGLASSGLHSNGFSLVRKVFSQDEIKDRLGRILLKPTRVYVKCIQQIMRKVRIKAMAHITGGGFYDNIPRVLPQGLKARIHRDSWTVPSVFKKIQKQGHVAEREMFHTFNMGIGLIMVVGKQSAHPALRHLAEMGQKAWIIGDLVEGEAGILIPE
jgi:phosphoribosylformylglycinamidine cyclo-ligase